MRNSDAYTITYKSSNSNSTGVSSGSGQKLSGHDFKKRDMYGEDRSGDFDDLWLLLYNIYSEKGVSFEIIVV